MIMLCFYWQSAYFHHSYYLNQQFYIIWLLHFNSTLVLDSTISMSIASANNLFFSNSGLVCNKVNFSNTYHDFLMIFHYCRAFVQSSKLLSIDLHFILNWSWLFHFSEIQMIYKLGIHVSQTVYWYKFYRNYWLICIILIDVKMYWN